MPNAKIIFERLSLIHFPVLMYYLWRRKEVRFFDSDNTAIKRGWIKRYVKEGKISAIPSVEWEIHECHGVALDNLEKFYGCAYEGSIIIRQMARLYGDERVTLAYKKELAKKLSAFYYINSYLEREDVILGHDERILLVPDTYGMFLKLAKKSGAFYYNHSRIDITNALGLLSHISILARRIKNLCIQLGLTTLCAGKLLMPLKRKGELLHYKYAIPITSPDYQFKFKTRSVDFLLDGKWITTDNALFILMSPMISHKHLKEMESKELETIDCSKRLMIPDSLSNSGRLRDLRSLISYSLKNVFLGMFENNIVIEVNTILLNTFMKWCAILQKIEIANYITFNDDGIAHIGRNVLLNRAGTTTWYYAHADTFYFHYVSPDGDLLRTRQLMWAYLCYDYYVGWNDDALEYQRLHPQRIDTYIAVGCLWSSSLVGILKGKTIQTLAGKVFAEFDSNQYRTIVAFDSSYLPRNSRLPLEGGVAFYSGLLKLLQDFADILLIVKEKKSEDDVLKIYMQYGGTSDIFYEQYKPILDELRRHPRCYLAGYDTDASIVIAMSDLTITQAFSSSTIEALGARQKAIFYDPLGKWKGCYYERIPNFMAHSYDELKQLVQKLLYETSEQEYEDYLDFYIKGVVDPYLDGKAVTRFRQLLSE